MTTLINFPQQNFELWSYSPSFNQLLIRGNMSIDFPKRIDVLFSNVAYLNLPTDFIGLTMELASPEQARSISSQSSGRSLPQSYKVFMVRGQKYEGYVVAARYAVDESTRPYNEPSIWELRTSLAREALKEELKEEARERELQARINFGETSFQLPPDFWEEMGQRYGKQMGDEYTDEDISDFIEGIKDGYAQFELNHWRREGQTCGKWFRNEPRNASHLQHPEEALNDFIEGIKDGYVQIVPKYWRREGQPYGKWLRNLSPSTSQHPEEALNDFIEGIKDGYAQRNQGHGNG
jgi:hypothetical protein